MNIKRTGTKMLNYLTDGVSASPSASGNNSVTKTLSFIYQPEQDSDKKEIYFYINVQPIDKKKEFVNLSFKYPDPKDPTSSNFLVAVDKYKAVSNRQDAIVKKCQKFLQETYDVDSIELLPDKLVATKELSDEHQQDIKGSIFDDLSESKLKLPKIGSKFTSFLSEYFGDVFKSNEKNRLKVKNSSKDPSDKSLTFDLECTMVEPNTGEVIARFPGRMKLVPSEDRSKVKGSFSWPELPDFKLPNDWSIDSIEMPNSKDKIQDLFWGAVYKYMHNLTDEEMKSFVDEFGIQDSGRTQTEDRIFDEEGETMENESVNSSKKLRFTLSKVQSKSGFDCILKNVFASYDPTSALDDIDAILEDSEFVADIPTEADICYEIDVADDGYDISEVSEDPQMVDECKAAGYNAILDIAYKFYFDCLHCNFIAAGPQIDTIRNFCSNYKWRCEDIIDQTSKMMIEDKLSLVDPVTRIHDICACPYQSEITWPEFISCMKNNVSCLISAVELYKSNFSKDKQAVLDGWLRTWNIELNYTLCRAE